MPHANKGPVIVALGIALSLSACEGPSVWEPLAQSNFAYPNSNVVPTTHVSATVSKSYVVPFQNPNFNDAALLEQAINEARKKSGGDIIVDGSYSMTSTTIPLLFIAVVSVDVTVEGTATKMELGKRELK